MATTTSILAEELIQAIMTNRPSVVKAYVARGGDPNMEFVMDPATLVVEDEELQVLNQDGSRPVLTALHAAIMNAYKVIYRNDSDSMEEYVSNWNNALCVVDTLIGAGAKVDSAASLIVRDEFGQTMNVASPMITPLALALIFNTHLRSSLSALAIYHGKFDDFIEMLTRGISVTPPSPKPPTTVSIPESVFETYGKLLLSPDQSDITFICRDGESFPAHRAILDAASPYFATAFKGPWAENNSNGEWQTEHPSCMIKAVLTFVYTGDLEENLMKKPFELLSIAGEYDITPLMQTVTSRCYEFLSVENLKDLLQLAHLHENTDLKTSCFWFAKKNMTSVLMNPDVLTLQAEDSALWEEFVKAIESSA